MNLEETAEFLKANCAKVVVLKCTSDYVGEDRVQQWLQEEWTDEG